MKVNLAVRQNNRRQEQYHNSIANLGIKELISVRESFVKLSANPKSMVHLQKVRDLCNIYLTQGSIVNNFYKVFGYRNETLALRFYNILADGYQGVHIYLPTFYAKL